MPSIRSIVLEEVIDAKRLNKDIKQGVSLVLVFYKVSADFEAGIKLSDEHTDYKWATKQEALDLVYETCKTAIVAAFDN